MKYEAWKRARTVENEFLNSLYKLVEIFEMIAKSTGDNQLEYAKRMLNFQNSYAYEKFIYSVVKRMVTPLAIGNFATWRKAARAQTKSRLIYNSLIREINEGLKQDIQVQILENIELIKTLPTDVARKVVFDIADLALAGERHETIAKIIQSKTSQHAGASARLIARTEVSKTTTALTRYRAENLGLKWYIWRTALDGDRVRISHRFMEGVLVSWSNPPSPEALVGEKDVGNYHAGEIWNCRCYPEPIIDIQDVRFPARVYLNGKVTKMNRKEFEIIV